MAEYSAENPEGITEGTTGKKKSVEFNEEILVEVLEEIP